MENEIRYYLKKILDAMHPEAHKDEANKSDTAAFEPRYIVTAVKLPTGAIELAANNDFIEDKIRYILEAYDDDMHLKTNINIHMVNIMIV